MNYSTTYIAVIVNILATFLPRFGITVGSEELTSIAQAVVAVVTGVWVIVQRYRKGDVTAAGLRK